MSQESTTPVSSTSRLVDVSFLTDVIASSSKLPLEELTKERSQAYLSNLTTFSLQDLLAEPAILQTQSHHLTSSLTSLTHTSYPTFLSLHQTTNALTASLTTLSSSLDSLLTSSLPALEECAAGWKERTDTILKERSKARIVLEQHEKIRDLLEIPILIDTCVRNGYFSEALSLVSHAKSLAANAALSNKPPTLILSSVLSEVHHSIMQMLLTLLTTLYEPNRKLPALWKAVNFLRKMDVFGPSSPFTSAVLKTVSAQSDRDKFSDFFGEDLSSEEQIALAFLVGRESCLKSTLEPCGSDVLRMTNHGQLDDREKEDLARYLKKYIDLWREGVYDVITQYSTIFLEKSSTTSVPQSPTKPASAKTTSDSVQTTDASHNWIRLHSLITTYASRALTTHLLPLLSPSLPLLSLSLLPSFLTQLSYCSTAFARVGLDFRSILSCLFSDAVTEVISHEMKSASDTFVARFKVPSATSRIDTQRSNGVLLKAKWETPSKWLIISDTAELPPVPVTPATALTTTFSQSPPHIPPQMLASYPPLAEHTNSLLGVLNGLRLLAPTNILPTLIRILDDDVLCNGGQALLAYIKAFCRDEPSIANDSNSDDGEDENEKEKRVIMAFGQVYFGVLIPFVRRALVEGVYGVKLDSSFEGGGESLPNVVMDWEDFVLEENEEDSGDES
ncbi:Conserved oligomeric Golgi complex subunit 8 [Psilocybe cubensis]|uniref:Conserved oligomeric Golgi complex subunit 8 n=2 Tax=Psilocybe cubensis TaxID=181762 RepID=A0A8H7Y7H3_PSICU|nr:Conserved oligomeric Golgi complex subunit 8 [Psilocybe cubensis]KAH9486459.1 Conserved oligomeric Golgi complex subunit 8 [Psilocybe cubensis]